jgi:uncharacterized glyoxalase superfamily protein PhnB
MEIDGRGRSISTAILHDAWNAMTSTRSTPRAAEQGLEISSPLRDEDWGARRFMFREPSGSGAAGRGGSLWMLSQSPKALAR